MKNNFIIIAILVLIVGLGGGFFAGVVYQKSQAPAFGNGQFRQRFGQGGNTNFRPVRGQILSMDSSSLTVKMMDGSSKIVVLSGSTTFFKSSTGSATDIKTGDTVMVIGNQNSDGSVTAQDVQINPPAPRQFTRPSGTQ